MERKRQSPYIRSSWVTLALAGCAGDSGTTEQASVQPTSLFAVANTIAYVEENTPAGKAFYQAPTIPDPSGGTITYALRGTDAALFNINSTGGVSMQVAPNYENQIGYSFIIVATSSNGNSSELNLSISIDDINEAPRFAKASDEATAIAENSGAGQIAYTPIAPNDPDSNDTLTYSLKEGGDKSAFEIDAGTGAITLTANPNYEGKPRYSVTIVATDTGGNKAELPVSLAITNENEAPRFAKTSDNATALAENSGANQLVYTPTAHNDPDINSNGGDTLTYSLKEEGDRSAFTIDTGTGAITLTDNPNYESKPNYSFTIIATDTGGLTAELPVSLAITNVNEAAAVFAVTTSTSNNRITATASKTTDDLDGNGSGGFAYQWQKSSTPSFSSSTDISNENSLNYTFPESVDSVAYYRLKITYTDAGGTGETVYTERLTQGTNGNDTLQTGTGDDTIDGGGGEDTLYGGDGNDKIDGGSGEDALAGGIGNDVLDGGNGADILVGGVGNDTLDGGAGNDLLYGGDGNDTLNGGGGNDTLDGGSGADMMTGGTGNDHFVLEIQSSYYRAQDIVTDFTSGDQIKYLASESQLARITDLATLKSALNIDWTNDTNDTVIYYVGSDGALGGGDDEKVMVLEDYTTALAYNDFRLLDAAVFSVTTSESGGVITATASKITDDPDGNGTFTYQWQKSSTNLFYFFDVTEISGATSLSYTLPTSVSSKAYYRLKITYTDGVGTAETAYTTNMVAQGTASSDTLRGSGGNDALYGGGGNDTLNGRSGADTLAGGAGADILTGGAGDDVFVLELASGSRGADVVTDFASGDKVQIDAPDSTSFSTLQTVNFAQLGAGETLHWVTNSTTNTRSSSQGNASTADTIFFIDADNDNALDSTETVVLILEDYTTALTATDFDIV